MLERAEYPEQVGVDSDVVTDLINSLKNSYII